LAIIGERRLTNFRPGDPERLLERSGWTIVLQSTVSYDHLDGASHLVVIAVTPGRQAPTA
jgi:hypothetical protein